MQVSNATPTTFQTFKNKKALILESINRFLGTQTRARTGMDCSTGV